MAGSKRLVVGLGNPGDAYRHTRHNVGFEVISALCRKTGLELDSSGLHFEFGTGRYRGRPIILAKPIAYMNRSGRAVADLMKRHVLAPSEVLVIYDDIHLPPGVIRMREGGSAAGHNGVQSVIDSIQSDRFPRLRIGIGGQFERGRQSEYVLSPFNSDEVPLIEAAIQQAGDAALAFVTDGIRVAMNRYNRKIEKEKPGD